MPYLQKNISLLVLNCKQKFPVKVVLKRMSEVKVGENESIESALKRFKKKVQKAGILSEIKRRERYEKPSVKRKRKQEAARKRSRKFY